MNTEAIYDQNEELATGVRLRNAREQLGLSQQTVAERLCLKVSTVRDIEEDKAPADLALTFLRGYIRSYAKLVHLSEEELLPMKYTPAQEEKVAPMQSFSLSNRRKKCDGWLMIFTWLVLFVMIGLTGAWWWQNHKAQQEEITIIADQFSAELNGTANNKAQKSVPLNTNSAAAANKLQTASGDTFQAIKPAQPTTPVATTPTHEAMVSLSQTNVDTVQTTSGNAAIIQQLPTDQSSVVVPAYSNALIIDFTADCWLEVIDATGKKIFSGLQSKDDKLNLTGQIPYKLKISTPAAVQIQFRGKPVDLSRFISTNQVACLTIS